MLMSSSSNTDFLKIFSSCLLRFTNHSHGTFQSTASARTREAAVRWEARKGWLGQSSSTGWHRAEPGGHCAHGELGHPAKLLYLTRRLRTRSDNNHGCPGGWQTAAQVSGLLWPQAPAPHVAALCTSQNLANTFPLLGPAGATTPELLFFHLCTLMAQLTTFYFPSVTSFTGKTNTFSHCSFIFTLNVQNQKSSFHFQQ